MQAIHRGRRLWPLATAALGVVVLGIGAYGIQLELRRAGADHALAGDFVMATACAAVGLGLLGLSVWGWLAVDTIDFDPATGTIHYRIRPDARRTVSLGAIDALSIVPARTFVFGRGSEVLMRVDRIDALLATAGESTVPLGRGELGAMREAGAAIATLPGARCAAPRDITEPRGAMDPTLRTRLQAALALGLHDAAAATEVRTALEASSPLTAAQTAHAVSSTEGSDPEHLRRMLEADAVARRDRRSRKKR
ncbi:MAG: hypothetical protein M3Y87_19750 [Myxococcota bacterium]|nr:hypothetical protein [Myxococcota bacterium]